MASFEGEIDGDSQDPSSEIEAVIQSSSNFSGFQLSKIFLRSTLNQSKLDCRNHIKYTKRRKQ